ncbi:uncharacterized protein RJT21DRAFT_19516 [Scheffersomyces amazonensis]|uniref:uncharacterized protein n=1 Tax=Scheffersomyces amazonensis TaxID=1078765 RepID=UPI00315DD601
MEEYLRESPSDYSSTNATTTPNYNYNATNSTTNSSNTNYTTQFDNNTSDINNININNNNNNNINNNINNLDLSAGFDFDLDYGSGSGLGSNTNVPGDYDNQLSFNQIPNTNDISNINYNNQSNNIPITTNPNYTNNLNTTSSNINYNNPSNFNQNSNQYGYPSNTEDYLSPSYNDLNINPTNASSFGATVGSGANSFTNEPLFDSFNPNNINGLSPGLPPSVNIQNQLPFSNQNQNHQGLDELISPPTGQTNYLDSQYFSPPLRPIPEDNQGIIPQQSNILNTSYLSPQANPSYLQNADSGDILRSPSNQSNYLNSPPQIPLSSIPYIPQAELSSSIPMNSQRYFQNADNRDTLSPPPSSSNLSSSVPSSSKALLDMTPTKQLTKDEKIQRRKIFHNEVERRRRELIKANIDNLRLRVPQTLLNPQLSAVQELQKNSSLNSQEINDLLSTIKVKESKPNKVTVLSKSVEYVRHLQYVLEEQQKERELINSRIAHVEKILNGTYTTDLGEPTDNLLDLEKLNPNQNNPTIAASSGGFNPNLTATDHGFSSSKIFNSEDFFSDITN